MCTDRGPRTQVCSCFSFPGACTHLPPSQEEGSLGPISAHSHLWVARLGHTCAQTPQDMHTRTQSVVYTQRAHTHSQVNTDPVGAHSCSLPHTLRDTRAATHRRTPTYPWTLWPITHLQMQCSACLPVHHVSTQTTGARTYVCTQPRINPHVQTQRSRLMHVAHMCAAFQALLPCTRTQGSEVCTRHRASEVCTRTRGLRATTHTWGPQRRTHA